MDVGTAYRQDEVIASGSVDAGLVPWSPDRKPKPVERRITYTNTTDRPITVQLAVDRGDSPAGAFALAADRVTVPARGTSTVGLVADPRGLAPGSTPPRSPRVSRPVPCTRPWGFPSSPRSTP